MERRVRPIDEGSRIVRLRQPKQSGGPQNEVVPRNLVDHSNLVGHSNKVIHRDLVDHSNLVPDGILHHLGQAADGLEAVLRPRDKLPSLHHKGCQERTWMLNHSNTKNLFGE